MNSIRSFRKKQQVIVALEGIDGAGKTTLVNAIKTQLGEQASVFPRTEKGSVWSAILRTGFISRNHFSQIPLYLVLSYKNYLRYYQHLYTPVLIMDRCFLSNICYYYPKAMNNSFLLTIALLFEVKKYPQEIYIIDVDPSLAHQRDGYQKDLSWLKTTRENYLASASAKALTNRFNIVVIPKELSIQEKTDIICGRIADLQSNIIGRERKKWFLIKQAF